MKLALGTVQFGLAYGSFNDGGAVPLDEADACLQRAGESGIDLLDTARAYGESENVLGRLDAAARFRIVTKVPDLAGAGAAGVDRFFAESLAALRVERVYGLMLHRARDLLGPEGDAVWRRLDALVEAGRVERVGVSVYGPEDALAVADRYPIGILQAPFSAFDQRMKTSGGFDRLAERGVEIHVRSVFLQGFALAEPEALPPHLAPWRAELERFRAVAAEARLAPVQLALAAANREPAIAHIVVGVQSAAQLDEIVDAAADAPDVDVSACASADPHLINPALWNRQS